jgi:hypothetical protein
LKTYIVYVHDGRYAAPTLLTIDAPDDESVLKHAEAHLNASPHYNAVEVWDDDRLVAKVER